MTKIGSNDGKFGGVMVNPEEIKSKKVLVDDSGNTKYIIEFKNGVKAAYMNTENYKASLTSIFAGETNYVTSNNVTGLEIEGSNKKDIITITGGSVANIDVSNDKSSDTVAVTISEGKLSQLALTPRKTGFGDIETTKQDEVILRSTMYIQKKEH